jgi:hypothetical protein
MNNMDLSCFILAETGRITQAITTGAAWEKLVLKQQETYVTAIL